MWVAERVRGSVLVLVFLLSSATIFGGDHGGSGKAVENSGSSAVFRVKGDVYPTGHFYTILNIGEPPKPYSFHIDTGSDLTWVNCDAPCQHCLQGPHPPYKPHNNEFSCQDPLCTPLRHPSHYTCNKPTDPCKYHIVYGDQTSSIGNLVKDNLELQLMDGSNRRVSLAFGCGYDQFPTGKASIVDGILGLVNAKHSILSQLHEQKLINNVFGHWLSIQGGGYLFFGDKHVPKQTVWVPRLETGWDHYSSGPAELLFDENVVLKSDHSFFFFFF